MAEPKLKLAKAKVLSVSDKSFDGRDGDKVKCWEIVLQNEDDTSQVVTGQVYKVLDERVKQDASVENIWVYEEVKGDRINTKLFFPKTSDGGGGGKYGGKSYGKSEAELKLARQELVSKIYSTHMSYVKDIMVATSTSPEFNWEDWYKQSKDGARIVLTHLKEIQEG